MPTGVKEPVQVVAVFGAGVKPAKFMWRGRVYPVKEITHTWRSKEGSASIMHFSVTDGASLYELSYNQETMGWTVLEGVE